MSAGRFIPRRPGGSPATAPHAPPEPVQAKAGTVSPAPTQSPPKGKQAPQVQAPLLGLEPEPTSPPPGDAQTEARAIVDLWVELMEEQDREARPTDLRVAQVQDFMQKLKISHDELAAYLRWVFRSDETWPKFMRKPERPYLALDNLLRKGHVSVHLDTAVSWDTLTGQGAHHGARFVAYYGGRAFT